MIAFLTLCYAGLIWLVFFPPAVYSRWINRTATLSPAGER